MKTPDRQAIIKALAMQIAIARQQENDELAQNLQDALEYQAELEEHGQLPEADPADKPKRNYAWAKPLPQQLHQAHAEIDYAKAQLNDWKRRRNALGIRYWNNQLERATNTLAELTSWLAQHKPEILQHQGDYKPPPMDEHSAPYDDDAPETLH